MQELHLTDRYRDDESIRVHVKKLPREIDPMLDYWEDNYIVRTPEQNLGLHTATQKLSIIYVELLTISKFN